MGLEVGDNLRRRQRQFPLLEGSGTGTLTPRRVDIEWIPAPVDSRPRVLLRKYRRKNRGSSSPQPLGRNSATSSRIENCTEHIDFRYLQHLGPNC